jgi:hypothetical protein
MRSIVIAFGPSSVTSRAAKTVRKLANPWLEVTIVPAHGQVAAELKSDGIEATADFGSRSLRAVLGSIDPGEPVLVIHDDALVTARGLRRLADRLSPATPIVIPFTNDTNTDHYVGTLPPPSQAAGVLDQITPPSRSDGVHAFRPCATVGYAGALLELATDGYVDPFRLIHDPSLPATLAQVVASHAGTCTSRLCEPSDDPRPLLVASMIVKDEESMLDDCLASLVPIVDRIEVCDTGSSDATVDIATSRGASISRFPWSGDFAAARNFVLERSRDARLVLHIDADERVECSDPALLRRYLATYSEEYEGFQPRITNLDGDLVTSQFRATRIFPAAGTRFDGPIHEVPMRKNAGRPIAGANLDLVSLTHLGYGSALFQSRGKSGRNIEIARRAYEESPGFRTAYDYGRSLLVEDEHSSLAAGLFEEALADIEVGNLQAQAYVYGIVANNRLTDGDHLAAMKLARRGLELVPREPGAAVAFAKAAIAADELDQLFELDSWRVNTRSIGPLFEVTAREAEYLWLLAHGLVRAGRLGDAYATVADSLTTDPAGVTGWGEILAAFAAAGADVPALFGPLAELEGNGRIVREAVSVLRPAVTAGLGLAYVERGGTDPDALAAALMAAMVAGEPALLDSLREHAGHLDPDTARRIVQRANARGLQLEGLAIGA